MTVTLKVTVTYKWSIMKKFLIYGSYGYTGNLIVEESVRRGFKPLLAGRDE